MKHGFIERLVAAQLSKKFSIYPNPEPDESSPQYHILFLNDPL
jgi:hypothetical protein